MRKQKQRRGLGRTSQGTACGCQNLERIRKEALLGASVGTWLSQYLKFRPEVSSPGEDEFSLLTYQCVVSVTATPEN